MAYDRYDSEREARGDRWRGAPESERRERDWRGGREEGWRGREEREERGFFERAGDEISSWFGGYEGRGRDERDDERGRYERERSYGRGGEDRQRGRERHRDAEHFHEPMDWTMSNRDYRPDFERGNDQRGYRPMAGDYGRSGDQRGRDEAPRGGYGRGSEWQRDEYRRTSFAGSAAESNHQDPPYDEWRRRHMDELDRDYDDYRRERQSHFESDFGGWREKRESKRQLLGRVREHMDVVGSDGEHVGTVDRVAGDKIILTKSDPDSGGHHHSLNCTMVDRIEDDRVVLDMDSKRARERWRDEDRDRALFEREDQGSAGPGMLGRSFSGTYR